MIRYRGGRKKFNFFFLDNKKIWNKQFFLLLSFFKNFKNNYVGLIKYANGSLSYINLVHGMRVGHLYKSSNLPSKYIKNVLPGYSLFLKFLKRFSIFSNLVLAGFAKYAKASGTYCKVNKFLNEIRGVEIWLPTGELRVVDERAFVTLGRNANIYKKYSVYGKAGIFRKTGFRPAVRGVAMNPVDHPHGGRTKTNSPEKSIWG